MKRYIGIEIGGTKVVVAHGRGPEDMSATRRIPTTGPAETLLATVETINDLIDDHGPVAAIGISSFGPVGLTPGSKDYGRILRTPKAGYTQLDLLRPIATAFPKIPLALDTDVNGAALGEGTWGAARGLQNYCYITVGTGIGVGVVTNGRPVHGLLHPEAGHILVKRDREKDPFAGICPFHSDCLEGLASGPAISARTGRQGEDLDDNDPVWSLVAEYVAQLCYSLTLTVSPERIIIGGGVGSRADVVTGVREHLHVLLGDYIGTLSDKAVLESYIASPALSANSGVLGSIALAAQAVT